MLHARQRIRVSQLCGKPFLKILDMLFELFFIRNGSLLLTASERSSLIGGSNPVLSTQKWHSLPIASVRRKRQRLPSSLLIENASARSFHRAPGLCAEAFPIKASDNPECATLRVPGELKCFIPADVESQVRCPRPIG